VSPLIDKEQLCKELENLQIMRKVWTLKDILPIVRNYQEVSCELCEHCTGTKDWDELPDVCMECWCGSNFKRKPGWG